MLLHFEAFSELGFKKIKKKKLTAIADCEFFRPMKLLM